MTKKTFVFVVLFLWGIYPFAQNTQANSDSIPFAPAVNYPAGDGPLSVFCSDLDRDGDLDLAVANWAGTITILKNNGNGTFQACSTYTTGDHPVCVYGADLDGDLDIDLAVANYGQPPNTGYITILKNEGNGTFRLDSNYTTGIAPDCVFCADLDSDHDLDIAVSNQRGDTFSILKNLGDGTFMLALSQTTGLTPSWIFCADLDEDGDQDLVTANENSHNVLVFKNNGDGTSFFDSSYAAGTDPQAVFCADLEEI